MNISMKHWWNDTNRGKPVYLWKNLSQCHFIHHESPMEISRMKPKPPQ